MKNIFVKYVLPAFMALTLLGHFLTSVKGLPDCDSGQVKVALNKAIGPGAENVKFTNLVERGKSSNDKYRYCKGVAVDKSNNWEQESIAFKYSIHWKDSKKKQFEVRLHD